LILGCLKVSKDAALLRLIHRDAARSQNLGSVQISIRDGLGLVLRGGFRGIGSVLRGGLVLTVTRNVLR
jgi:hypothetical protein